MIEVHQGSLTAWDTHSAHHETGRQKTLGVGFDSCCTSAAMSTPISTPSGSASAALSSGSPRPLTVILESDPGASSDFFPFNDVANLNPASSGQHDDLSFRQLIEDGIEGGQEIILFDTGCRLPEGVTDCTRACNSTNSFFGDLETFYNCAALASISYWTRAETVYYISEEAEKNASSIMGDGTLAAFEDRPVLEMFVDCAQDACRNDGLAVPCDEVITSLSNSSSARDILDAIDNFCPSIEAEINPDIFGPGVRTIHDPC